MLRFLATSNVMNICFLIMSYFTFMRWWVGSFEIEYYICYLIMRTQITRRVNFGFHYHVLPGCNIRADYIISDIIISDFVLTRYKKHGIAWNFKYQSRYVLLQQRVLFVIANICQSAFRDPFTWILNSFCFQG